MMGEPTAAVLGADDGEHLLNASGEVVIKIDPRRGSAHPLAQHPTHCHRELEYRATVMLCGMSSSAVLDSSGTAILGVERVLIQKGATIFIPTGAWHGFEESRHRKGFSSCRRPHRLGRRNSSARFLVALANHRSNSRRSKCWRSDSRSKQIISSGLHRVEG